MLRNPFFVGITSVLFLLLSFQCTSIEYNNPIDVNGTNRENLLLNPNQLLDINPQNGVADYLDSIRALKDTTKPVIKLLLGDTVWIQSEDNNELNNYLDANSIQYSDAGGGPLTFLQPQHDVNIFVVNSVPYTINYTVIDTSGNQGKATRYVYITATPQKDKPPSLTLTPDTVYITQGGTFVEPNITAFDLKDRDLRDKVTKTGSVDTLTPGTYTITYRVSNSAGLSAEAVLTVIVTKGGQDTDNIPPVIQLIGADTLFVPKDQTIEQFKAAYVEPGYSANDNIDGDITAKVTVSPMEMLSTQFWVITYSVSDNAGNQGSPKYRYINTGKTDGIAPVIDLNFPDSIFILVIGDQWVEPGYTAIDVKDNVITDKVIVVDTNLTNNITTEGSYQILYSVTNSDGLTTRKIRYVKVVESEFDTKPPVITLIGRNPDTTLAGGDAYVDPGATAMDNRDGDVTAKISVSGTVNVKTLGKYTLTYRCSDNAGYTATATRVVYVVRDTLTTDILVRYNVPTETPLPEMANIKFTTIDIDGDGPTAVKTAIKDWTINWSLREKLLRGFAFQYNADPYYKDVSSGVTQTFGEVSPYFELTGSEVEGLDGEYYITYDAVKGECIWVDKDGMFAIIWTE
jgi:hypothetical protein